MSESADARLMAHLQLALVPGVGPRLQRILLGRFGSAAGVLAAGRNELRRVPGVGPKLAAAIADGETRGDPARELETCRRRGIDLLTADDAGFPSRLREIVDPPLLLYRRGTWEARDGVAVAIVGARRCSAYGRRITQRLAGGLARAGVTIVSGLARGVDGIAHRAALDAGGRTIAVLACGLTRIYPPEHADLASDVADRGALLTEFPLDQAPLPGLFPQRNRLVSGLALGVIVVEASRRSGALHTARHAGDQNRELLAVPGPVDSPLSEGCHDLLRDGATLCRGVDDVLEALGPLPDATALEAETAPVPSNGRPDASPAVRDPRELSLNDREREVLALVTTEPRHLDEVLRGAQLDAPVVLSTLTVLEMKRLVQRMPGGYLVRPQ